MTRHLTGRFWFVAVGSTGALLIALAGGGSGYMVVLALPWIWALTLGVVDGFWPEARVDRVEMSNYRIIEGDIVEFVVTLSCIRPVPWLELELQLPAALEALDPTRIIVSLRRGETLERTFRLQATRWGVASPEWLTVVTRDRLGLSEVGQHLPIAQPVRIHPPTEWLTTLMPLHHTRSISGDHRSRRRGEGTELAEVRPYRSGDPVRRIHPGLSLRRGEPMILERHPEQSADVVIFIDSVQDIGSDLNTTLRWTVTAAMALSQRHLRSMDRVGILDRGAGVRWLPLSMGRQAGHVLVDALLSTSVLHARFSDEKSIPFNKIPANTEIFCISPLLSSVITSDLISLRRKGHEVVVIRPQPNQLRAEASLRARRIARVDSSARQRELEHSGVIVVPWDPTEALEPTLARTSRRLAWRRTNVRGRA